MSIEWKITLRRRDGWQMDVEAIGSQTPLQQFAWIDSGEGQVEKFMQFGKKRDAPKLLMFDLAEHDAFNHTALYIESEETEA